MGLIARRLLPVLQLTRMALAFTAVADTLAAQLLRAAALYRQDPSIPFRYPDPDDMTAVAFISIGLYGFGMSLNDIIDRRRDRQLAAHRPLPSGRLSVLTAHIICAVMAGTALAAGISYAMGDILGPSAPRGKMVVLLLIFTGLLIVFYDYAGKYLVAPGLLTLGLIRFFQSVIPVPEVPLIWHPLWLLNHVTILSTIAYLWEAKRPTLTKIHFAFVFGGLGLIDLISILLVGFRRAGTTNNNWREALWISPGLILPIAASVVFLAIAIYIYRKAKSRREAGQQVMLLGLLWLIVYDAAFVWGYVGWLPALGVFSLLPVSYLCVQLMRWWSNIISLAQPPQFRRAGM